MRAAARDAWAVHAGAFLGALADPARAVLDAADIVIIVAHPDDETIGCGAQLRRLRGVLVAVASDGAPLNLVDAHAHGFATAEAYAKARAAELRLALTIAGVPAQAIEIFGIADQALTLALPQLTCRVADVLQQRDATAVVTHAFEGGHPDHDAVAFAVHAAAALLRRRGRTISIVEMPLYRKDRDGMARQRFAPPPSDRELVIHLGDEERALKRRMIEAYATQQETLAPFSVDAERFRPAPDYDFTMLPNGGELLYEQYDWGMSGARWRTLATDASRVLGLVRTS